MYTDVNFYHYVQQAAGEQLLSAKAFAYCFIAADEEERQKRLDFLQAAACGIAYIHCELPPSWRAERPAFPRFVVSVVSRLLFSLPQIRLHCNRCAGQTGGNFTASAHLHHRDALGLDVRAF